MIKGKKKFDPIDRDIIRSMDKVKLKVTPAKVAETIGVHPSTAKKRMENLEKRKIILCERKGNRMKCKLNKEKVKKTKFF